MTESGFPEKRSTAAVPGVETITEAPTGGSACPLAHLAETAIEEMAIIVPVSTETVKNGERDQRTIEDAVKVIALDDIASLTRATTETDRQEHVEAFPVLAPPFHALETHHRGAFNGQRAPFHLSQKRSRRTRCLEQGGLHHLHLRRKSPISRLRVG